MGDERQPVARPADAEALARELVGALAALATPPPGGPAGPPAEGAPLSLAGPRQLLENASRFVAPHLPADARMRSLKAVLLRALRIVTRDQTVFNSALLEAVRSALLEIERALVRQAAEGARLSGGLREREDEAQRLDRRIASETAALAKALEREGTARNALGGELVASQKRLDAIEAAAVETRSLAEQVRLLRLELSALRGALADRPSTGADAPAEAAGTPGAAHAGVYAEFEETFRGSEAEIRERQRRDVAFFAGAPGPVADLGCGRGEFLEVLADAGLIAVGCDSNPVMVARGREKGLLVEEADLFAWLGSRPDGALGGLSAYQVIEHLPPSMLLPLVELAARKLAPGGRLLFETVNPESVYAMRWFWMDLTHVRPVPAPSMAQLLSAVGFRDVKVDFRSPVPAADALPAGADPALEPVARLLFAPQDYAVTGVR